MAGILREHCDQIVRESIRAVLPDCAVKRELKDFKPAVGKTLLVAIGKAAWQMADTAVKTIGRNHIDGGIVITKYEHVKREIPGVSCYEAGHPVPDENSFLATAAALKLVENLTENDMVVLLLSGGGSALFEKPMIPGAELQDITKQLLACGADIVEMNTIRKHLSEVKGGRFALACSPAKLHCIVLSDIIGDPLDMIASGPAYPDSSTSIQAAEIVKKYDLRLSEAAMNALRKETPSELNNVTTRIIGSVRELCKAAGESCRALGYQTFFLTDRLCCEAREAGSFLASVLKSYAVENPGEKYAFIAGGETIVHLTGAGKGGRNQELALSAAPGISGIQNAAVFSFGSDGTDGPTDAAGGFVDGHTMDDLKELGIDINDVLINNDAYHALDKVSGLIKTGPTGTNVNDVAIALLR